MYNSADTWTSMCKFHFCKTKSNTNFIAGTKKGATSRIFGFQTLLRKKDWYDEYEHDSFKVKLIAQDSDRSVAYSFHNILYLFHWLGTRGSFLISLVTLDYLTSQRLSFVS